MGSYPSGLLSAISPILNVGRGVFPAFHLRRLAASGGWLDMVIGILFIVVFAVVDFVRDRIHVADFVEVDAALVTLLIMLLHAQGQRINARVA